MRTLSANEVSSISGAGLGDAVLGWVVGKVLDGVSSYVGSLGDGNGFENGDPSIGSNTYGA